MFSYGETKDFFLNDSLFGILTGPEMGVSGIVVAGTSFTEL